MSRKGHITDIFNWQLAKLEGAHVTATCGARNVDLIRSLGADEVLDYNTPEGKQLKSPSGKKYDAVFHCAHYQPFSYFKPQLTPDGKVLDPLATYCFQWQLNA
jgi:NADPH:quinone reductase-like Zn-dependent oxidoreductase